MAEYQLANDIAGFFDNHPKEQRKGGDEIIEEPDGVLQDHGYMLYHSKIVALGRVFVESLMRRFAVIFAALTSVVAIPSHAQVSSMLKSGELLGFCTEKVGSAGRTICDGYMMGYMAGANGAATVDAGKPGPAICFPLQVSAEDVREAFVRRMTDNSLRPDVKTFDASGVMMVAASDKYPCPGAK